MKMYVGLVAMWNSYPCIITGVNSDATVNVFTLNPFLNPYQTSILAVQITAVVIPA
jgi:uncharacterized SAM-binding protein YcdF (DUF218 family)